ncbi:MAG: DUF541 domain-containing protein [Candidatus Omnitrophota bacterium]|jgi:uncharacterized protein YggE|nr:MAG: DUF541 domain-containing protein [Candidatus Omnitrophota bacterium]
MRKVIRLGSLAISLVLLLFFQVRAQDLKEPRLITVTGEAEIKVAPDEVVLTLGVETNNKDINIAKSENDLKVQKIIAVAKRLKIEEKHIQTDYINIEPRYKDQWENRDFVGYFVRKNISITLRDTSKFEELLSSVLDAGVNYVHGIDFRTTELRKHRDEARALAIKAAQEKANDLAKQLNQAVGKPYKIQEGMFGWWSGYFGGWGRGYRGTMSQNVVQNAGGSAEGGSSIALGQITVKAQITVSFELE